MSKLVTIIRDSQVLGPVVRNSDGSNTYITDTYIPLALSTPSPGVPFDGSSGLPSTVQGFVRGALGATATVQFSLNGVHWVTGGTLTFAAVDGDTQQISTNQTWSYVRATITVQGAGTTVTILGRA